MNRRFLSLPRETTWRLFGSAEWNPAKHPTVVLVFPAEINGDGVATMFLGTLVRIGWPSARKLPAWRVTRAGIRPSAGPITSAKFLVKLGGAIVNVGGGSLLRDG